MIPYHSECPQKGKKKGNEYLMVYNDFSLINISMFKSFEPAFHYGNKAACLPKNQIFLTH